MSLYIFDDPILNLESLTNQSYALVQEIIFYIGFLIVFAVQLPIILIWYNFKSIILVFFIFKLRYSIFYLLE